MVDCRTEQAQEMLYRLLGRESMKDVTYYEASIS